MVSTGLQKPCGQPSGRSITIETIASATAGLNDRDDRTLYRIVPRVSWRWSREWEISGQYEYAEKDEDNESGTATRNAVYLTLSYRPHKLFISR